MDDQIFMLIDESQLCLFFNSCPSWALKSLYSNLLIYYIELID